MGELCISKSAHNYNFFYMVMIEELQLLQRKASIR